MNEPALQWYIAQLWRATETLAELTEDEIVAVAAEKILDLTNVLTKHVLAHKETA